MTSSQNHTSHPYPTPPYSGYPYPYAPYPPYPYPPYPYPQYPVYPDRQSLDNQVGNSSPSQKPSIIKARLSARNISPSMDGKSVRSKSKSKNPLAVEGVTVIPKQKSTLPTDEKTLLSMETIYDNEIKRQLEQRAKLLARQNQMSSQSFIFANSSNPKIRELEVQVQQLTKENSKLNAEKEELGSKIRIAEENSSRIEAEASGIFSNLEKKNAEHYRNQLGFKFANNDKDTIALLQQYIAKATAPIHH